MDDLGITSAQDVVLPLPPSPPVLSFLLARLIDHKRNGILYSGMFAYYSRGRNRNVSSPLCYFLACFSLREGGRVLHGLLALLVINEQQKRTDESIKKEQTTQPAVNQPHVLRTMQSHQIILRAWYRERITSVPDPVASAGGVQAPPSGVGRLLQLFIPFVLIFISLVSDHSRPEAQKKFLLGRLKVPAKRVQLVGFLKKFREKNH